MGLASIKDELKGTAKKTPRKRKSVPKSGSKRKVKGIEEEGFLSRVMESVDTAPEDGRPESDYTHVSTLLHSPCARRYAIEIKYDQTPIQEVTRGMRVIWALGRAAETHVRKGLITALPHMAYGWWTCACGYSELEGTAQYAYAYRKCGRCRTPVTNYREYTMRDPQLGVIGNPDLLLLEDDEFTVVECKSVNTKGFENLKKVGKPVTDHALQSLYYRRMGERKGMRMSGKVIILYVHKDYKWGKSPYLEYPTDEDGKGYRIGLNAMDSVAHEYNEVRKQTGSVRLPARHSLCKTSTNTKAAGCSSCTLCFSV